MSTPRYIVLDTETTGLGPDTHRLLEIAALLYTPDVGKILTPYHVVINPERSVSDEAALVHGWTNEKLKDKPVFKEVAAGFLDFVRGAHIVIHNAPFDVGFLDTELERNGFEKLTEVAASITCTLKKARTWLRDMPRHTLDALCVRYNIDRSKRVLHGALIDCELLVAVTIPLLIECKHREELLNAVLPRPYGAPLPETLEEAALAYLDFQGVISLIEKEQARYQDQVKRMAEGLPVSGEKFSVEFSESMATDWKKVQANLLVGANLKPYQKGKAKMSIKRAKAADGTADADESATDVA